MLVRRVDVMHGLLEWDLVDTKKGDVVQRWRHDPTDDAAARERALRKENLIASIGFPGSTSPDRGSTVLVLPGPPRDGGAFEYDVRVTDGERTVSVALLPAAATCPNHLPVARAHVTTRWATDGSAAVIAGSIEVEDPCGSPRLDPVLVLVPARGRTDKDSLRKLVDLHAYELEWMMEARPGEAGLLVRQLLAIAPRDANLLLFLSRLRARTRRPRSAIAALWAVYGLPDSAARSALARAIRAGWTAPLRRRAAFAALWGMLEWLARRPAHHEGRRQPPRPLSSPRR